MEYVEASNLKQLTARADPALAEKLGNILIDMAVALEHVHDSGFMHLDFKPENVLVTRNGNVRLVDFDLAKRGSRVLPQTGQLGSFLPPLGTFEIAIGVAQ